MYFDTRIKYVKNYKANTVVKVKLTLFTTFVFIFVKKPSSLIQHRHVSKWTFIVIFKLKFFCK